LQSSLFQVLAFVYFVGVQFSASTKMSTEAAAAIVFGILQVGIGLAALWQQRQAQARQLQSTTPLKSTNLVRLKSCQG
jgi:protein-S-isoprenylcysteine O-methyltransferase Ste14